MLVGVFLHEVLAVAALFQARLPRPRACFCGVSCAESVVWLGSEYGKALCCGGCERGVDVEEGEEDRLASWR